MTDAASALPHSESVTRLIPGGAASLAHVTDDELLANTRRLVGRSNQLLAALLLHLGEVETRGAHRMRSCASLYTYCIYELRFSEDAAARRSAAARFVKQFPALLAAVADGELHLTGLLMIGPYLTPENQAEVLGRARFRTKKELAKLLRELNPLPGIPDLVQPLGPEPVICRDPTWPEFVAALCPPVRELPASEQPRSWANDGTTHRIAEGAGTAGTEGVGLAGTEGAGTAGTKAAVTHGVGTASTDGVGLAGTEGAGLAGCDGAGCDDADCDGADCDGADCGGAGGAGSGDASASEQGANEQGANEQGANEQGANEQGANEQGANAEILPVGPAPADLRPITGPQRYQLQFETVEEHVQLIERAKVLMARERPRVSLGELHLEAMKLLVASLERRKHATGIAHQRHSRGTDTRQRGAPEHPAASSDTRQRGDSAEAADAAAVRHARSRHLPAASDTRQRGAEQLAAASDTRQRGAEHHPQASDARQCGAEQLPAAPDMHQPSAEQHPAASDTRRRGAQQHQAASNTRQRGDSAEAPDPGAARHARSRHVPASSDTRWRGAEQQPVASDTRQRRDSADAADAEAMRRARSRHVPAALRREVYERDAGRCGYVDARGERCREMYFLEVHHLEAFALGGRHRAANLSLRCPAHNRLAAERDFGEQLVATHRDAARHESLSRQRARDPNVR